MATGLTRGEENIFSRGQFGRANPPIQRLGRPRALELTRCRIYLRGGFGAPHILVIQHPGGGNNPFGKQGSDKGGVTIIPSQSRRLLGDILPFIENTQEPLFGGGEQTPPPDIFASRRVFSDEATSCGRTVYERQ